MRSLFILLSLAFFSCSEKEVHVVESNPSNGLEEIKQIMKNQENAWNNGSLEEFMDGYWKSDSLLFIGKSGINRGWEKTLSNYHKSYSNRDEMGRLEFKNEVFKPLNNKNVLVIGKWTLFRSFDQDTIVKRDTLQGHYSLNWQFKDEEWVIIADHSS